MSVKTVAYSNLVLRILALSLLLASAVIMLCNSYKLDGDKTTWKDIKSYRYVFVTAVIGVVYMLIQIPFALYYAVKEKRLIQHSCLPEFDFYADKLISYILATGVGAGFAASLELKQVTDSMVAILAFIIAAVKGDLDIGFDINQYSSKLNQFNSKVHKFQDRGIIATVLLTLGFACMAVISVISSLNRSGRKNYFG